MKTFFRLIEVQNEHAIAKSSDANFLFLIQHAALLGLKDVGCLNEMQFRQAEEMLLQQYRINLKANRADPGKND